jgi:hypothetical protein
VFPVRYGLNLYINWKKFKGLVYSTRTAMAEDGDETVLTLHVVAPTEVAGPFGIDDTSSLVFLSERSL